MDGINMLQNRDKTFGNIVMNLWVVLNAELLKNY